MFICVENQDQEKPLLNIILGIYETGNENFYKW